MPMTFHKYIDNPSESPSVYTMRDMYRQMYRKKFEELLVRESGKLLYKIINVGDANDTHYFVFKIPSESLAGLYYDVVIKLWAGTNGLKNAANFKDYFVQFFSNDQAFTYTFEYSFNKNKLLIPELRSKCSEIALKQPAAIKNPKNEVWYVKSFVFAFYAMERYNLFSRPVANQVGVKYNRAEFLSNIASFDRKMEEHAKLTQEKKKKEERERLAKQAEQRLTRHGSYMVVTSDKAPVAKTPKTTKSARVGKVAKVTTKSKVKRRG